MDGGEGNYYRRKKNDFFDMYIVVGGVLFMNNIIGNDVNVFDVIWLVGCCVRGGEIKLFVVYVRNV